MKDIAGGDGSEERATVSENCTLPLTTYVKVDELTRIGSQAAVEAQEESRRLGVPNVYSINGYLYYETPDGTLSLGDPYVALVHRST